MAPKRKKTTKPAVDDGYRANYDYSGGYPDPQEYERNDEGKLVPVVHKPLETANRLRESSRPPAPVEKQDIDAVSISSSENLDEHYTEMETNNSKTVLVLRLQARAIEVISRDVKSPRLESAIEALNEAIAELQGWEDYKAMIRATKAEAEAEAGVVNAKRTENRNRKVLKNIKAPAKAAPSAVAARKPANKGKGQGATPVHPADVEEDWYGDRPYY